MKPDPLLLYAWAGLAFAALVLLLAGLVEPASLCALMSQTIVLIMAIRMCRRR